MGIAMAFRIGRRGEGADDLGRYVVDWNEETVFNEKYALSMPTFFHVAIPSTVLNTLLMHTPYHIGSSC